jgi:hypothetical protein
MPSKLGRQVGEDGVASPTIPLEAMVESTSWRRADRLREESDVAEMNGGPGVVLCCRSLYGDSI